MKVTQLSVFLENKPGALSEPVNLLAGSNVNILALSLADTQQFGILRLIVDEVEKARLLLEQHGLVVKPTEMVVIEVADKPGGLAGILKAIEGAGVNLEYMYGFTSAQDAKGLLAFRFNNPDLALAALRTAGIRPVQSIALLKRRD